MLGNINILSDMLQWTMIDNNNNNNNNCEVSLIQIRFICSSHAHHSCIGETLLVPLALLCYPDKRLTTCRREYIALAGSLILIFLEVLIRVITLGLRTLLARTSLTQLSDFFQPNQSLDSAITDPKISSTYFPPLKATNHDQSHRQSLRRSQALQIL